MPQVLTDCPSSLEQFLSGDYEVGEITEAQRLDLKVEASLYRRATGYDHRIVIDPGLRIVDQFDGYVTRTVRKPRYEHHHEPASIDVIKAWLQSRQLGRRKF